MGSDYKKPLGITVIRKRDVPTMIWPLPVGDMLFIGKKSVPKLNELGIKTIGDLANFKDLQLLKQKMGENFVSSMLPKVYGNDDSPVVTDYGLQTSYSHDQTFMKDVYDENIVLDVLHVLTNEMCYNMQEDHQVALNVGISIKEVNGQLKNMSKPLFKESNRDSELFKYVKELFTEYHKNGKNYRLVGVFTNRVKEIKEEPYQLSIFDNLDDVEKEKNISKLLDSINKEFGKNSIKKGI